MKTKRWIRPLEQAGREYELAMIPNLERFELVAIKHDGSSVDAVVAKDETGHHHLVDCLGERLTITDFKGWRYRPDRND